MQRYLFLIIPISAELVSLLIMWSTSGICRRSAERQPDKDDPDLPAWVRVLHLLVISYHIVWCAVGSSIHKEGVVPFWAMYIANPIMYAFILYILLQ